jgi:pantetheine-phosphate adenylyltransferase
MSPTQTNTTGRVALFPGSFDPFTNGHLDVIRRGLNLFDKLIVAVGRNPEKQPFLPSGQRVAVIRQIVADLRAVEVKAYEGLTVDFARQVQATAILRGIRNTSDLQHEFQVALTNRVVAGVETVFIMTSTEFAFTSSSLIRQIASMGGDISALVPPAVVDAVSRFARNDSPDDNTINESE